MSQGQAVSAGQVDAFPITLHGPAGVVDLVVPAGAQVIDVAREYAAQSHLGSVPLIHDRTGRLLPPADTLDEAGVEVGHLLVATTRALRPATREERRAAAQRRRHTEPGALATLWASYAVALAALAGLSLAPTDGFPTHVALWFLAGAAVLGVLPGGRYAVHRAMVAPAFAAAATYAHLWDPDPARLPGVIGVAGLVAAMTAALARALQTEGEEGLRVWIVAGLGTFAVTSLAAFGGFPTVLAWALLVVLAAFTARFVSGLVVDVPDSYLLDMERLAVTAWSARTMPRGKRGRVVVPETFVVDLARRGSRLIGAATVAVAAVAVFAAFQLVAVVEQPLDRIGVRVLLFCAGATMLLAARSYRHTVARVFLRVAGLGVWLALLDDVSGGLARGSGVWWLFGSCALLSVCVVIGAVATGRGWRSARLARRADFAEGLTGAVALASVLVASGTFRIVWDAVHARMG